MCCSWEKLGRKGIGTKVKNAGGTGNKKYHSWGKLAREGSVRRGFSWTVEPTAPHRPPGVQGLTANYFIAVLQRERGKRRMGEGRFVLPHDLLCSFPADDPFNWECL